MEVYAQVYVYVMFEALQPHTLHLYVTVNVTCWKFYTQGKYLLQMVLP